MIIKLQINYANIIKANFNNIFLSIVVDGLKKKLLNKQKHILSKKHALAK